MSKFLIALSIELSTVTHILQKMKFFIKDFFSKYDQIRRKLRIWSHLLKKSLMENFIFCAVTTIKPQRREALFVQRPIKTNFH